MKIYSMLSRVGVNWSKTLNCDDYDQGKSQRRRPITWDEFINKEMLWGICNSSSPVLEGT